MTTGQRPALFIGSSVEGLDVAYALQELLEFDAEPTVWPQGVFSPTSATLSDLLAMARKVDFAAFVFTPDDVRTMRKEESKTPRDNVVFELGLLIGARGPERCFFLMPSDAKLTLPSDLLGLAPLTYVSKREDANLLAALGPAANKIRRAFRQVGPVLSREAPPAPPAAADPVELVDDFIGAWNGGELLAARQLLRRDDVPMHMVEDETGEFTGAIRKVFAFLESLADGVLEGRLDEARTRAEFAPALHAVWERAASYLAPLNSASEWWDPLPRMAVLDRRWGGRAS